MVLNYRHQSKGGEWETVEPFSFYWDGNQVTQWLHSGENGFDWWTFQDTAKPTETYDFGWDIGEINDPTKGSHWSSELGIDDALAIGDVTVSPIPEPSSLSLIVLASAGLYVLRRNS